ncbi:glycyl radical protein [Thermodesulfobacteriota bacterium]
MSERITRLKETIRPKKYPIGTEIVRLVSDSYRTSEGEPQVLRVAGAQANLLNNISIFIEDDELIVGQGASKPMGVEVSGWSFGVFTPEGIHALKEENWGISDEEEAEAVSYSGYWQKRNPIISTADLYDEERLWPFLQSGILLPPWQNRQSSAGGGVASGGLGFGLGSDSMSVDYKYVISKGLNQIIAEAQDELKKIRFNDPDSVKRANFLKASIINLEAIIGFANRYSALASEMAAKETNPKRKKELERIAEICQWVPANPARTFYEAIQFFWFIFLILAGGTTPFGRFDQFMYPYYEKDIQAGVTDDEEVLDLLQCLRIKDMQLNTIFGQAAQREKWSGMAKWNNMVVGGVTPEGKDATNDMTYLILEAARRCPTPHHTVTLRVHNQTPEKLMLKAVELLKEGVGMPAFVGDKSYTEYLMNRGVPIKKARDYYIIGCLDANVPEGCASLYGMFIVPQVLEVFMHNGILPRTGQQLGPQTGELESFQTFDDLMQAFKKQLAHFMSMHAEYNNITWQVGKEIFPDTMVASLFSDGIRSGKTRADSKLPYQLGGTINPVGMINVADSLAAIKKLVFDEKKVSMKELKAALEANWQGNGYGEIQKMCVEAPKYGNDDDYVDSIARELYQFYADYANTMDAFRGGKYTVAAISITAHGPGGAITGATPDGRYAGETLADGTTSPAQGKDTKGPIAVIKSAAKIDQALYQSTLMNMKFHPSAVKSTEDMRKLSSLIKTYFSMGGKHMQFNVVGKETLQEAQARPDIHKNLVVRVAGYSAYFVQLGKTIQEEIIERMEYEQAS